MYVTPTLVSRTKGVAGQCAKDAGEVGSDREGPWGHITGLTVIGRWENMLPQSAGTVVDK